MMSGRSAAYYCDGSRNRVGAHARETRPFVAVFRLRHRVHRCRRETYMYWRRGFRLMTRRTSSHTTLKVHKKWIYPERNVCPPSVSADWIHISARRYPPLRRCSSRHTPACLFREGNLCEADTVPGKVREAILSEMTISERKTATERQMIAPRARRNEVITSTE